MKGQEWYQAADVAEEYEDKRFSRGGRLIDTREREAVIAAIGPVEHKSVLEIACGTGRFTVMLGERGAQVVGVDISVPMLQQGVSKAHHARVSDQVQFIRGDAGGLPFPDDAFDAVFAMRFLHLAPSPLGFLREMRRVTRDTIFFDTFNAFSSRAVYNWLLPMGSRLYDDQQVENLVRGAGLELADAAHDWILPYGLYRKLPGRFAEGLREFDLAVGRSGLGRQLASVSYWDARIP